MEYLNKIDKKLLYNVKTQGMNNNISFLVSCTDIIKAEKFLRSKDYEVIQCYPFISSILVSGTSKKLNEIASKTFINYISSEVRVLAQINNAKEVLSISSLYKQGIYGKGVTVAVIDTGVSPTIDFMMPENKIIKFVDFQGGNVNCYDDNGHGTFVSSIILGSGYLSKGKYSGIAPKSCLVSLKALDGTGETGAYKILDAMQWIYDNHKKYNIKVVCMSFGSEPQQKSDPLLLGAEMLWKAGIVVVAAAGNSGPEYETIKSPGISRSIITVGGLDEISNKDEIASYKVASFSSRGPVGQYIKPDILAPATNIKGAHREIVNGKGYVKMSGTSVAAPIIAGVCALLIEKHPFITPNEVKKIIISCGHSILGDLKSEGNGFFKFDE